METPWNDALWRQFGAAIDTPPAHFAQGELDSAEATPERPYSKDVLRAYLASTRQKCHRILVTMTDEEARRVVPLPWSKPPSYLELQLYTMRHVQEHAAQMGLFLGQQAMPDADATDHDWVPRAYDDDEARCS